MDEDKIKTAEQLAAQVKADFTAAVDKAREVGEKALAEAEKTGKVADATKALADEALLKLGEMTTRLTGVEQKMVQQGQQGQDATKSVGEQFVSCDAVKTFMGSNSRRGRVDMEVKATITSSTANAAGSVGSMVAPERLPGILGLPQRRLMIRDLISPGTIGTSSLMYVRETLFTNNAGMVGETGLRPESDMQTDDVTTTVKTIGHTMTASREILEDAPQLQSLIDARLLYGLALKEESQLLFGDGTGQNLLGIMPQATAFSAAITLSSPTSIDIMRLAMLQAALAEFPATGHVLNPIDWTWIETLKDGQGRYIIGNPQGSLAPTLWGLPVVTTQSMPVDTFLTGAFAPAAQLFDRRQARVEISTEDGDNFKRGKLTLLAEERLALAVYRPQAFISGDFGRVA